MKNSPRNAVALILNLLHENFKPMSLTDTARDGLADTLGAVKVAAGLVLLAALSWEIIAGDHVHMSGTYLTIQFIVCLVFLCDFFVRWTAAERRTRFFWRNLPFLLLSPFTKGFVSSSALSLSASVQSFVMQMYPLRHSAVILPDTSVYFYGVLHEICQNVHHKLFICREIGGSVYIKLQVILFKLIFIVCRNAVKQFCRIKLCGFGSHVALFKL